MKHASDGSRAASVLLVLLVLFAGCQRETRTSSVERAAEGRSAPSPSPADSMPLPELAGIWTVVGHHIPGTSAMSDKEATAWHGRTVRLTAKEAISAESHCDAPSYATSSAPRDRFLGVEFHLPPGALKPLASRDEITLLDVSCRGSSWADMGGRLIGIDANRVLAPWNGVFFELARDHDVRALGQEPFWNLEIRKGKELRFVYDLGERQVVTPMPVPRIEGKTTIYHATTEANDLRVIVEKTPCTDSMSGQPFEATVTVTLNGQTYHGCGGLTPGSTPARTP